eukprot:3174468-Rhodomonas_salina.4
MLGQCAPLWQRLRVLVLRHGKRDLNEGTESRGEEEGARTRVSEAERRGGRRKEDSEESRRAWEGGLRKQGAVGERERGRGGRACAAASDEDCEHHARRSVPPASHRCRCAPLSISAFAAGCPLHHRRAHHKDLIRGLNMMLQSAEPIISTRRTSPHHDTQADARAALFAKPLHLAALRDNAHRISTRSHTC